jgi:hypothetical protein
MHYWAMMIGLLAGVLLTGGVSPASEQTTAGDMATWHDTEH